MPFLVSMEKEEKVCDKKSREIIDTKITCKLKFTDSSRFMPNSLSNLVENLADEIYKSKCKDCADKCSECMAENWKMKYRQGATNGVRRVRTYTKGTNSFPDVRGKLYCYTLVYAL